MESEKGYGELTIDEGATLTNNGCIVVYGKLYVLRNLVNNGKYNDLIISNDPDKGLYAYHKGIQVAWKDDVTQKNVEPGTLYNGIDRDGNIVNSALLINNGDILLNPGTIENYGTLTNNSGANIYAAVATEAIIPVEAAQNGGTTPAVVTKRITLDNPQGSSINSHGIIYNGGTIQTASVVLNDNGSWGDVSAPSSNPDLVTVSNDGIIVFSGPESNTGTKTVVRSIQTANNTWLYLYSDKSFLMIFPDGSRQEGSYTFLGDMLTFVLEGGTVIEPAVDEEGNDAYSFTVTSGYEASFVMGADFVAGVHQLCK